MSRLVIKRVCPVIPVVPDELGDLVMLVAHVDGSLTEPDPDSPRPDLTRLWGRRPGIRRLCLAVGVGYLFGWREHRS